MLTSSYGINMLCSLTRRFNTHVVPFSTKVYKMDTSELTAGGTLRWTSIPSWGAVEILLVA